MKRLLTGAAMVAALGSGIVATPASAALGGTCDGKIDVACTFWWCVPSEDPCMASPVCLVWLNYRCVV